MSLGRCPKSLMDEIPDVLEMNTNSNQSTSSWPVTLWVLTICLVFLGISAMGGGGQFLIDPTGDTIGMPVDVLGGSPFADFFIPGLILFIVLGVLPFVVLYGIYTTRRWARLAVLLVGIAVIVWIIVQGLIVGFGHWLQWLYLGLGFFIILLGLLPSVRKTI